MKKPRINPHPMRADPPAWLAQRAARGAGKGLSKDVSDRAFWLNIDDDTCRWITTLEAVDADREVAPLIAMLRSDRPMSAQARWHVADLLERHQLKCPPGRQRTPSYDRTELQARFESATAEWREQEQSRKLGPLRTHRSKEEIAERHNLNAELFEDHLASKRKQSRAVKSRLPRPLNHGN